MQRVLTNSSLGADGMLYGTDEGHPSLRRNVAAWLNAFYAPAVQRWRQTLPKPPVAQETSPNTTSNNHSDPAARITITGSASANLGVLLNVVTDPCYTRRIWIVAPGYFLAFKTFEDAGFAGRLRAVPEVEPLVGKDGEEYDAETDMAGPDVEWLRREIAAVDAEYAKLGDDAKDSCKPANKYPRVYRHVIYTVPNFANPSGLTTSLRAREALVRCAREFDALVVCDDVYDMLQWPAEEDVAKVEARAHEGIAVDAAGAGDDIDAQKETQARSQQDTQFDIDAIRRAALKLQKESSGASTAPGTAPLPRLLDIDRYLDGGPRDDYGSVISNGSFSKICAPGTRCGWLEAEPVLAFAVSQA